MAKTFCDIRSLNGTNMSLLNGTYSVILKCHTIMELDRIVMYGAPMPYLLSSVDLLDKHHSDQPVSAKGCCWMTVGDFQPTSQWSCLCGSLSNKTKGHKRLIHRDPKILSIYLSLYLSLSLWASLSGPLSLGRASLSGLFNDFLTFCKGSF